LIFFHNSCPVYTLKKKDEERKIKNYVKKSRDEIDYCSIFSVLSISHVPMRVSPHQVQLEGLHTPQKAEKRKKEKWEETR